MVFCQLLFAQCKCFFSLKQPHPPPSPSERELHFRFHEVLLSFPLFIELYPALPLSAGEGVRGVRLEVLLSFPLFIELYPALSLSAGEGGKGGEASFHKLLTFPACRTITNGNRLNLVGFYHSLQGFCRLPAPRQGYPSAPFDNGK